MSLEYAASEADSDDDYPEQDEYTLEEILASAPGRVDFKVRWKGYGPSHDTREPVSSFVSRIDTPFMEYLNKQKKTIRVSDFEALTRAIEAGGD